MALASTQLASVRYLVDDVDRAAEFYTTGHRAAPAFTEVMRGPLRLRLSGPTSSGPRLIPDGSKPVPGGWDRIQARVAALSFRNNVISGPVGQQILLPDRAGNLIELFQPANR